MSLLGREEENVFFEELDDVMFHRGDYKIEENGNDLIPYAKANVLKGSDPLLEEAFRRLIERARENGCRDLYGFFSVSCSKGILLGRNSFTVEGIPYIPRNPSPRDASNIS